MSERIEKMDALSLTTNINLRLSFWCWTRLWFSGCVERTYLPFKFISMSPTAYFFRFPFLVVVVTVIKYSIESVNLSFLLFHSPFPSFLFKNVDAKRTLYKCMVILLIEIANKLFRFHVIPFVYCIYHWSTVDDEINIHRGENAHLFVQFCFERSRWCIPITKR